MGSHKSRKEKHKKSKKSKSRSYDHEEQDDVGRPVETGARDLDYQTSEKLSRTTETERKYKQERPLAVENEFSAPAPDSSQRDGGDGALSMEETNRLRAKLGLKPLQTGGQSSSAGGQDSESVSYEDRADVHAPASNLSSAKSTKKLRERVDDSKEKRRISKKLNKVQSLGVDDFDNERETTSASDWVRKMRENEIQKEMANKRAKMLEEIEQDFGISDVMREESNRPGRKPTTPKYSRKDLAGFRIEHKSKEFKEGSSVIVTLKDQDVLGEGEDVLENVNMNDDRKAVMNIENRKRKPDYMPYDDEEDAAEMPKFGGILKKYDEDKNDTEFFRLDHTGNADDEDEKELEIIRRNLMAQQQSLQSAAPRIGMDYYTTEEMVKFKKPGKKRRKIRKKEMVKADDLLPLDEYSKIDYGSRKSQQEVMVGSRQPEISPKLEFPDAEVQENDEADMELQTALERSRNANIKKRQPLASALQLPKEEPDDDGLEFTSSVEKKKSKGSIVLDSTSEFCRTLGEDNAFDAAAAQELKPTESTVTDVDMDMETAGGWEQVTDSGKKQKKETQKHEAVLEEEPDLKVGIAAALKVASNKGLIEAKKKKTNAFQAVNLPDSKAVIDEDKMRDEMRDRYHRHDPYGFKEKEKYKPDVKLEYIDQHGRQLSEKEAFRFLSHRFHGKGSGKMKTEKRAKKMTEEMKLKNMSAIDTPLNTMQMMSERQQLSQTPYVVLSGGGKNLLTTNIISKK